MFVWKHLTVRLTHSKMLDPCQATGCYFSHSFFVWWWCRGFPFLSLFSALWASTEKQNKELLDYKTEYIVRISIHRTIHPAPVHILSRANILRCIWDGLNPKCFSVLRGCNCELQNFSDWVDLCTLVCCMTAFLFKIT